MTSYFDRWISLLNMVQIKLSFALIITAQAATAIVTVVALPVPTGPAAMASTVPHTRPKLQLVIPTDSHPSSSGLHSSVSPVSNSPSLHNVSPDPRSGFHTYDSNSSASNSPLTYVSPMPPPPKKKKRFWHPTRSRPRPCRPCQRCEWRWRGASKSRKESDKRLAAPKYTNETPSPKKNDLVAHRKCT